MLHRIPVSQRDAEVGGYARVASLELPRRWKTSQRHYGRGREGKLHISPAGVTCKPGFPRGTRRAWAFQPLVTEASRLPARSGGFRNGERTRWWRSLSSVPKSDNNVSRRLTLATISTVAYVPATERPRRAGREYARTTRVTSGGASAAR